MINNKKIKILVIGDIILDVYIDTLVDRVSPEAPVLVAKKSSIKNSLGGAANVANNLSKMGIEVLLIGIVGKDDNSYTIKKLLDTEKIRNKLVVSKNNPTITKTRINSSNKQILRLDDDNGYSYEKKILEIFKNNFQSFNAVLLSDYNKGTLIDIKKIIKISNKYKIKTYIDPKSENFSIYKGAYLLKPNKFEFDAACKKLNLHGNFNNKARLLFSKLSLQNLVITKGSDGMFVLNKNGIQIYKAYNQQEVFDVTGAGDTVISTIVAYHEKGVGITEAVKKSNFAASLVIKKIGTSYCSMEEIENVATSKTKLISEENFILKLKDLKEQKKKIVITNGCFDILHPGHCDYLNSSKSEGDILIVFLNSDKSVKYNKGQKRPINNFSYRSSILSSLSCVDFIIKMDDKNPLRLIKKFKPDVLTKGSDYNLENIIGAKEVLKNNGKIKIIKLTRGYSTTNFIKKIKK